MCCEREIVYNMYCMQNRFLFHSLSRARIRTHARAPARSSHFHSIKWNFHQNFKWPDAKLLQRTKSGNHCTLPHRSSSSSLSLPLNFHCPASCMLPFVLFLSLDAFFSLFLTFSFFYHFIAGEATRIRIFITIHCAFMKYDWMEHGSHINA